MFIHVAVLQRISYCHRYGIQSTVHGDSTIKTIPPRGLMLPLLLCRNMLRASTNQRHGRTVVHLISDRPGDYVSSV